MLFIYKSNGTYELTIWVRTNSISISTYMLTTLANHITTPHQRATIITTTK